MSSVSQPNMIDQEPNHALLETLGQNLLLGSKTKDLVLTHHPSFITQSPRSKNVLKNTRKFDGILLCRIYQILLLCYYMSAVWLRTINRKIEKFGQTTRLIQICIQLLHSTLELARRCEVEQDKAPAVDSLVVGCCFREIARPKQLVGVLGVFRDSKSWDSVLMGFA